MLDALEGHVDDGRFHLIAPPGAGKTSLGIEVVRRLGGRALVLAPTIPIRDQWIERLRDFVGDAADRAWPPTWASTDLRHPEAFTAVTYQAVWAASEQGREAGEGDAETLAALVRTMAISTVVLDEAHHLTQSWWRVISEAVAGKHVHLVSLTATPPYDAPGREWRRYEELCGPVDEEVATPELVRSGTLAPHQDFVCLVPPGRQLARTVTERDQAVEAILSRLSRDAVFADEVLAHPWLADTPPVTDVLDAPEVAAALLAYVRHIGGPGGAGLEDVLGLDRGDAPMLTLRMWQVLLYEYLFGATFTGRSSEYRDALATELRTQEILWRRELRIGRHRDVERSLALSASKVQACVDVHLAELTARGRHLRQVILTDFIREEALEGPSGSVPTELGAVPVWDALVAARGDPSRVALLTGRLQLLASSRVDALAGMGEALTLESLPNRPGWMRVAAARGQSTVDVFTRLLEEGELDTLVGTRSLLGQGWDAPELNSVVLASFVGSFVSTNQMRGRALRRSPRQPDKTASIWHLAALLPDTATGVADVELLRERFRTFVGPSWSGDVIESGMERLEIDVPSTTLGIDDFNRESFARLGALGRVAEQWDALTANPLARVKPTVGTRPDGRIRSFHVRNTLRHLVRAVTASAIGVAAWRLAGLATVDSLRGVFWLLTAIAFVGAVAVGPDLVRAIRLAVLHLPIDGSLNAMGEAVLRALRRVGLISPDPDIVLTSEREPDGTVRLTLANAEFRDQQTFADAMSELLGPVENPRYLVTRAGRRRPSARDVHPVPGVLGRNRESAGALLDAWRDLVGPSDLLYTRAEGGRELLLKARAKSFATNFDPRHVERLDRWA